MADETKPTSSPSSTNSGISQTSSDNPNSTLATATYVQRPMVVAGSTIVGRIPGASVVPPIVGDPPRKG